MRALRNTPQPPPVPMDGRLPNKFGNSSAPVFSLHVRRVCGLSLIDAVRVFEQVLIWTVRRLCFTSPAQSWRCGTVSRGGRYPAPLTMPFNPVRPH